MVCGINNNIIFCLFLIVSITNFVCLSASNAYAHIPQDTTSLQAFSLALAQKKPLVYTDTDLRFSIQELTNGNHIKDLIASITITKNGKIFFKFNDVEIQNGDLSLKVRFFEDGNYQVISQFSSTDNIALALASFDILVLLQPFGKFNVDSLLSSLIPAALVAIGLSSIVIILILILRKREIRRSEGKEKEKIQDK